MSLDPSEPNEERVNRRSLLRAGAGIAAVAGGAAIPLVARGSDGESADTVHEQHQSEHAAHSMSSTVGDVDVERMGFDPSKFVRTFDYGEPTTMQDGTVVREWQIVAVDKEIEIAPGIFFPAWTYNGQVPGPTLRCNEGDRLRITFVNNGSHPHTMHFHGIHRSSHDGVPGKGKGEIEPGSVFVYDMPARPFGCHLYHCHAAPLKRHIQKGLYGAFIVNPDPKKRGELAKRRHPDYAESEEWQEFIMVMNAFDTNFDAENEVYAVNTVAFHYMKHPIQIDRSRPVRIYLVNMTEHDPVNTFHLHANFFDYYDTGTQLEPTLRTVDMIMQAQAQRGILEFRYDDEDHEPGSYMFHAHVSEFGELGWMSMFDVR
jgi:FtsP/CotA-like multicopper oxidase with cupredoxin domain